MPKEEIQQPTTLLSDTVKFSSTETQTISNTIRYLLSGMYYQQNYQRTPEDKPTTTQIEVYRKIAATLPIEPKDIINEMAKIRSEILDEQEKGKFLQNARIFLQELMLADSFDQKFKGLKDYLRDNEIFNDAKMAAHPDPVVQAFYQMIKNEPEALRNELYGEARMTALHDQVLRKDNVSGKNKRVDVRQEQREIVERNTATAGTVDIDRYISVELTQNVSAKSIKKMAADVARDLKNRQLAMLAQIQPSELENQAWMKRNNEVNAPHVLGMINGSNQIASMVVSDLVMATDQNHQQRIYDFYINVLNECMENRDFHTALAIVSGFNNSAIERLSKGYLKDTNGLLAKHSATLAMTDSYKNLRAKIQKERKAESIPFIGLYLKDLTFIQDGNLADATFDLPDKTKIPTMNLARAEMLGSQLTDVQDRQERALHYLSRPTASMPSSNIVNRTQKPMLTDEVAYKLSLEIYSRDISKKRGTPFKDNRPEFEKIRASGASVSAAAVVPLVPVAPASASVIPPLAAVAPPAIVAPPVTEGPVGLAKAHVGSEAVVDLERLDPRVKAEFLRLQEEDKRGKGKKNDLGLLDEAVANVSKLQGAVPPPQSDVQAARLQEDLEQRKGAEISASKPQRIPKKENHLDHELERQKRAERAARLRSEKRKERADTLAQLSASATVSTVPTVAAPVELKSESAQPVAGDLELRRSQALDAVKAAAVQAVEAGPVRDEYYKMVEGAANKAAHDFNLPREYIPGIIEAVYNDPKVLYSSPSAAYTLGPITQLPSQKKAAPEVPQVPPPVAKIEILDKSLNKFLEISKGIGAASVQVMFVTLPIARELKRIKDDPSLNAEQKEEQAFTFLLKIANNPNTLPSVKELASSFLVEPAFAKLDKLNETGQKAVRELEAQTQQRAAERAAKAALSVASEPPVSNQLKADIQQIEQLSSQAIQQASVEQLPSPAIPPAARQSVAADIQTIKIADIAKRVALNSPVWLIEAGQPERGRDPIEMTVVRVADEVAIDRQKMPMQRGSQWTYPVTTKVHALSRLSSQPGLFATMGPDQFLSKEGVKLQEDTVNRIVNLFQNKESPLAPEAVDKLKNELKNIILNELDPPRGSPNKGYVEVYNVLSNNSIVLKREDNKIIGDLLQTDLGGRHVALVAQEIGVGDPKRYAALTIAGTRRSEASGFGIERGRVPEGMASLHTTTLQDKSVVPTASVVVEHNPNINKHLVLQSGGEIDGKLTTLAFYGSDLDHIVKFYLTNKAEGVPIVVNCTDGIDRTGMLVTAIAMLNEYNNDKENDFTKNDPAIQEKRLLQIIEELRQDRGPFFLRGNADIAIAITLGYALIATQKQLGFQKYLDSRQGLNPLLKGILDQSKQIEPEALQMMLNQALGTLTGDDAQIADEWLSLVTARVTTNNEYLKVNRKGDYKDSFDRLPRHNMSDGDWARERKPISFSDFDSLKQKGIDVNPFIAVALRHYIESPTIKTTLALAEFIEANKSNGLITRLMDSELEKLGLNKDMLNTILRQSTGEKIDTEKDFMVRLNLPFSDFDSLKQKGVDEKPFVHMILRDFIESPSIERINAIAKFIEINKSYAPLNELLDKELKNTGLNKKLLDVILNVSQGKQIDGDMLSRLTLQEKETFNFQLKVLAEYAPDDDSKKFFNGLKESIQLLKVPQAVSAAQSKALEQNLVKKNIQLFEIPQAPASQSKASQVQQAAVNPLADLEARIDAEHKAKAKASQPAAKTPAVSAAPPVAAQAPAAKKPLTRLFDSKVDSKATGPTSKAETTSIPSNPSKKSHP